MNADEVRERLRGIEDPALGDGVRNVILNSKHWLSRSRYDWCSHRSSSRSVCS